MILSVVLISLKSIYKFRSTGSYEMTNDELVWGTRMAWRNASRCPARAVWKNLKVFDKRNVDDTDAMFEALLEHLEYSSNGGNIRTAITVFRQRTSGLNDPRMWNSLVIQFAGYQQEDGSIVGDPATVDITNVRNIHMQTNVKSFQ